MRRAFVCQWKTGFADGDHANRVATGRQRGAPASGSTVRRKPNPSRAERAHNRSIMALNLLLLLALSTLWGASYAFIRVGVETIPPLTFIAARTLIAGTLLGAWMWASGIALPRDLAVWRRFLVQALLNSVIPF